MIQYAMLSKWKIVIIIAASYSIVFYIHMIFDTHHIPYEGDTIVTFTLQMKWITLDPETNIKTEFNM